MVVEHQRLSQQWSQSCGDKSHQLFHHDREQFCRWLFSECFGPGYFNQRAASWHGAGSGSPGVPAARRRVLCSPSVLHCPSIPHCPSEGTKGPGCGPRAPLHPCIGLRSWQGRALTLCPPLPGSVGAGAGLFWAEILGFALDKAIQMALTCEAVKNPR